MLSRAQQPDLTGYPSCFQGGQVCTRYWYEFYPGTKYVCYSTRKLRFEHRNRLSLLRARITLYTFDDTDRFRSGTNTLI